MTSMVGSRIPHSLRQGCLSRHRSLQPELHMNADAAVCSSLQVQTNRNTDVLGQFGPLCCNVFGASQHTLAALFNRFFHSVKGSRWQEELITSLCRVCSSLYTSSPTWGHCCVITVFLVKHFCCRLKSTENKSSDLFTVTDTNSLKMENDSERFPVCVKQMFLCTCCCRTSQEKVI